MDEQDAQDGRALSWVGAILFIHVKNLRCTIKKLTVVVQISQMNTGRFIIA
jgi:hypothetical protein